MTETAKKAYITASARYEALLSALSAAVQIAAPDDIVHWGHVGSLNHANDRLAEVLSFLDGTAS